MTGITGYFSEKCKLVQVIMTRLINFYLVNQ